MPAPQDRVQNPKMGSQRSRNMALVVAINRFGGRTGRASPSVSRVSRPAGLFLFAAPRRGLFLFEAGEDILDIQFDFHVLIRCRRFGLLALWSGLSSVVTEQFVEIRGGNAFVLGRGLVGGGVA